MGTNTGIALAFLAPPVIIAAVSFLLAHVFDDSDRHRGMWAKLRARYLLTNIPPSQYAFVSQSMNYSDTAGPKIGLTLEEVLKDFLYFRGLKINYGIISLILVFGFSLLIAILLITIIHFICLLGDLIYGHEKRVAYVIIYSFSVLTIICCFLQATYISQNRQIAKRIKDFDTFKYANGNNFLEEGYEILKIREIPADFHPGQITSKLFRISKVSMTLHLNVKPFWISFVTDVLVFLIFASPYYENILMLIKN